MKTPEQAGIIQPMRYLGTEDKKSEEFHEKLKEWNKRQMARIEKIRKKTAGRRR